MSNYIHDLAERVLTYWARVEELEANPVPPPDPADFYSTLGHFMNRPRMPKGAVKAFDALEQISDCIALKLDRTSTLYVKTIFTYRIPRFMGETSNTSDIECSVQLAEDLVTLKYLFSEPSRWPEHKLLSVSSGFPMDEARNALDAFYENHSSVDTFDYFKQSDCWIYKPSYGELVTLRMPTTDPVADKQLVEICAEIVRICEQHSIYRFRKTKANRIEFDWDFLRFERPDNLRRGAVRLVMPPWLASVGMKDNFPRNALSVVLKQEQRKTSTLSEQSNLKHVPDDVLLDACSKVVDAIRNSKKGKNFNELYGLINAECHGKLSISPDPVAVGKTIKNRLRNIDTALKDAFVGWCDAIKSR